MELGGNAPFIVFNSANIDNAVQGAMASKFRNCGQTCVSANRFFIQENIFDEFVEKFGRSINAIKMGNGAQPDITAGPLINKPQFQKVSSIVEDALTKGAKAVVGGKPASAMGNLFFEPTLLVNINRDMRVFNEEVFGPVATVIKFNSEEEVIKMANDTRRGLAGY